MSAQSVRNATSGNKVLKLLKNPLIIIAAVVVVAAAVIALLYGFKGSPAKSAFSDKISQVEKLNDSAKPAEAEKMANEILSANPDEATKVDAYWELAIAESAQGKYDKALEHAKAIEKQDSAGSHYLQGLIYFDSKQNALAKKELTLAAQQDSYYKQDVDELLKQLQ